jgi:hypothetical protein
MFLVAFIKREDFIGLKVKSVLTNYLPMGLMNIIGNKGGLILQFNLYQKLFSFINVHLASGAKKADLRAEMMGAALRGISVSKQSDRFEPDAVADFNFIIGDLNSRFTSTYTEHIDKVKESHFMLSSHDELYQLKSLGENYPGYHEEPITFMPTYKCDFA